MQQCANARIALRLSTPKVVRAVLTRVQHDDHGAPDSDLFAQRRLGRRDLLHVAASRRPGVPLTHPRVPAARECPLPLPPESRGREACDERMRTDIRGVHCQHPPNPVDVGMEARSILSVSAVSILLTIADRSFSSSCASFLIRHTTAGRLLTLGTSSRDHCGSPFSRPIFPPLSMNSLPFTARMYCWTRPDSLTSTTFPPVFPTGFREEFRRRHSPIHKPKMR